MSLLDIFKRNKNKNETVTERQYQDRDPESYGDVLKIPKERQESQITFAAMMIGSHLHIKIEPNEEKYSLV